MFRHAKKKIISGNLNLFFNIKKKPDSHAKLSGFSGIK
jgi:hypothetical protein